MRRKLGNCFYVYVYFRLDGSPLYVGKGHGDRWRSHLIEKCRSKGLRAYINEHGKGIPCVIVRSSLTEEEAFQLEVLLIRVLGRQHDGGPLVNLTLGGEGCAGLIASLETRNKLSLRRRNRKQPRTFSEEARENIRRGAQNRGPSKLRGKPRPADVRQKLREKLRAYFEASPKPPLSEESKRKVSESQKRRWDKVRARINPERAVSASET